MSDLGLGGIVYVETNVTQAVGALGALGRSLPSVVGFAAKDVGRKLKLDLQSTTRTWQHRPEFIVPVFNSGDGFTITGGTEDQVWNWLDAGTRPHEILPRTGGTLVFQNGPYVAKSIPHFIGSRAGGPTGTLIQRRRVWHPGIANPRKWAYVLSTKYAVEAPAILLGYLQKWSLG